MIQFHRHNKYVIKILDSAIVMSTILLFIFGEGDRRSIQIYTIALSVLVLLTQIAIILMLKKSERRKRVLYTGLQMIFYAHLIVFYSFVLLSNSKGIDYGTWSSVLRAQLALTMAWKERAALAKQIRREVIT